MAGKQYLEPNIISIFLFMLAYTASYTFTGLVKLQINFEKNANKVEFMLNCSTTISPFGRSAEILINNITTANMRSSNGSCYISRRICKDDECSCRNHYYVWSFWSSADTEYLSFTCQFRFEQRNIKSHLLVYTTKIFNGSAISDEKTSFQEIVTSMSNSSKGNNKTIPFIPGSDDSSSGYIYIWISVPVVIIILSMLCFKCFKVRKLHEIAEDKPISVKGIQELQMINNDEAQPLSPEESYLPQHGDGRLQTTQANLYDILLEQESEEEKVMICPSISEVRDICEITDDKPICLKELQMINNDEAKPLSSEVRKQLHEIAEDKPISVKGIQELQMINNDEAQPLSPEESYLPQHGDGRLQTIHANLYDIFLEQETEEEKVMICPSISEEQKINGIGGGRPLSLEDLFGVYLQTKQTQSCPALYETENNTKRVKDKSETGKFANSLDLKELSLTEEYLQTKHAYSDPTFDYPLTKKKIHRRIMPDESAKISRESTGEVGEKRIHFGYYS